MAQADTDHNTTRRAVLRLGAYPLVAGALAAGTGIAGSMTVNLTASPDPTFAAIEAHRAAIAAYNAYAPTEDALEAIIPEKKRQTTFWDEIVETDDPRWIEHQREVKRLCDIEIEAESALCEVIPTTLAGVIALLEHAKRIGKDIGFRGQAFAEDENDTNGQTWHYFAYGNIAGVLKAMVATWAR